jgi:hypothetical protein
MRNSTKTIGVILLGTVILYLPFNFFFIKAEAALNQQSQEVLPLPRELTNIGLGLAPTDYTPDAYIEPSYDPFSDRFKKYKGFEEEIPVAQRASNTPPTAVLNIRTEQTGLASANAGTTSTTFIFDGFGSRDEETVSSDLRVRFDFDGDGTPDTFFSKNKTARHRYEKPGIYNATMQVLDGGGLIDSVTRKVMVVVNTNPVPFFTFEPLVSTTGQIFTFDTSRSYDSQYERSYLQYRFDWNGDGQWDTPFKTGTRWEHRFSEPGIHRVIMEVRDPEGASSFAEGFIRTVENTPPVARFSIERDVFAAGRFRYHFDASGSFDVDGQRLEVRWDFNYTGPNDINFDTFFSSSPRASGYYDLPGEKVIRLQVRDSDGAISEAFAMIVVE